MHKLTPDQQSELEELQDSEGRKALYLLLENCVMSMENDVLSLPLVKDNEQELLYRKCRAEGGRKLLRDCKDILKLDKPRKA